MQLDPKNRPCVSFLRSVGRLEHCVTNDIFDFIEKLKSAELAEEKFRVFALAASEMGFEQSLYGFSRIDEDQDYSGNAAIYSNFDFSFLTTYEDEKLADHDISVRHCTVSDLPAPWFDERVISQLSDDEMKVERIAIDHGFRAGLTIPTREGASGHFGGVSVATRQTSKAEFEKALAACEPKLQLMALCLHADIQRTVNPYPVEILTPREKEVLIWASLGLSSKQTARKLGIAFRTVEWHLEQARLKLSANNKIHTVAKAVANDLIPL